MSRTRTTDNSSGVVLCAAQYKTYKVCRADKALELHPGTGNRAKVNLGRCDRDAGARPTTPEQVDGQDLSILPSDSMPG